VLTSHKCLTQLLLVLLFTGSGLAASAQMKPGVPYGWKLHGSRAGKYECGVDADTTREGKPSAYQLPEEPINIDFATNR